MGGWEKQAALNEAIARDLNEDIEAAHEEAGHEGYVPMLCECGRADCEHVVPMTLEEYEGVREDPRRFALAPEHLVVEIERVVEDEGRFLVVEKRPGIPATVAEDEDPRHTDD
ncbi:MAG: hypothetical protein QOD49_619 [Actinomycetota bacterium]|nr:hypothetical protein [Actinomycetota bacterium]